MPSTYTPVHMPLPKGKAVPTLFFKPLGPQVTLFRPTFKLQVIQTISFLLEVQETRICEVINHGWIKKKGFTPPTFFIADTAEITLINRNGNGLNGEKLKPAIKIEGLLAETQAQLKALLKAKLLKTLKAMPVKLDKEQLQGAVEHLESIFLSSYETSKVTGFLKKSWGTNSIWCFTVRPVLQS